ncbi:MAG: prolipoprotein diacylglyceryl transferase family protein [Chloroflexota bacterium]
MRLNRHSNLVFAGTVALYVLTLLGIGGYLWHLNSGTMPNRVAFNTLGLYDIYWYGIILLVSFLVAAWLSGSLSLADQDLSITFWYYPIWITSIGLLFARLFDVFLITPVAKMQGISTTFDYFRNPSLLFNLAWGGLNPWGAVYGVGILLTVLAVWRGKSVIGTWFRAIVALLIVSSLAQWGHFLNQELYGYPTQSIMGITIAPDLRLPSMVESVRFVPVFLFAAIWYLAGSTWLIFDKRWYGAKHNLMDGALVGLIWYVVGKLYFELSTPNSLLNWLPASLILLLIVALAFKQHLSKIR